MSRRKQYRPVRLQDDDDENDENANATNLNTSMQSNDNIEHPTKETTDDEDKQPTINDNTNDNEKQIVCVKCQTLLKNEQEYLFHIPQCSSVAPLDKSHKPFGDANNNNDVGEARSRGSELALNFTNTGTTSTVLTDSNKEAAIKELAMLQSTLFTLQHQQVLQFQLIQQLQSQLGQTDSIDCDTKVECPLNSQSKDSSLIQIDCQTPINYKLPEVKKDESIISNLVKRVPETSSKSEECDNKFRNATEKYSFSSLHSDNKPICHISQSLASTIITNHDTPPSLNEPNSLEMLQKTAQDVLDSASQGLLAGNLADELAFRKDRLNSDGKSGRNEPFFKHRCRYCGKVFGSDSALQIHLRSHTGERPFICNVCGSRFTTKGNLKVHFQRHTMRYPQIPMNSHSMPDHLDKFNAQLLPSGAIHDEQSSSYPHYPILRPPINNLRNLNTPSHSIFGVPQINDRDSPPNFRSSSQLIPPRTNQQEKYVSCINSQYLKSFQKSIDPYPNENDDQKFEDDRNNEKSLDEQDSEMDENDENMNYYAQQCRFSGSRSVEPMMQDHYEIKLPERPLSTGSSAIKINEKIDNEDKVTDRNECEICHRVMSSESALMMHYSTHAMDRLFRCKLCGQPFTTTEKLKEHIQMNHEQHIRLHNVSNEQLDALSDENSVDEFDDNESNKVEIESEKSYNLRLKYTDNSSQISSSYPSDRYSNSSSEVALDLTPRHSNYKLASSQMSETQRHNITANGLSVAEITGGGSAGRQHSNVSTCPICLKTFACNSALEIHFRSHTKERPFKCTICERGFSTKSSGVISERGCTCNGAAPYRNAATAPVMNYLQQISGNLKQHMTTHKHSQQQKSVLSSSPSPHQEHLLSPTVSPTIKTTIKRERSTTPISLDEHPKKVYIEDDSNKIIDESRDGSPFDARVKLEHSPIIHSEPIPASQDNSPYKNDITSLNHLSNLSSQIKSQLFANETPRNFETSSHLYEQRSRYKSESTHHSQNSISVSPISSVNTKHYCSICRKNFSSSSALQIHNRTHTGDKPFRCSVCQKAFTTKGNLKVHMGTHMWSNSASRRGRRMSLELPLNRPLPLSPQDSEFLQRRPDLFYPYIPAPFLNGMQHKLNEIGGVKPSPGLVSHPPSMMNKYGIMGYGGFIQGPSAPILRPHLSISPSSLSEKSSLSPPNPNVSPFRLAPEPRMWDLRTQRKVINSPASTNGERETNKSPTEALPLIATNVASASRGESLAA